MWQTPVGIRSLGDAEADLWIALAGVYQSILIDMAENGDAMEGDLAADSRWARLRWEQQVVAIGEVTRDLLSETSVAPRLSAWNELTIHEVFEFVLSMEEDDPEPEQDFYELAMRAAEEAGLQVPESEPGTQYYTALRLLRDRILWDREIDQDMISDVEEGGLEAIDLHPEYWSDSFPSFSIGRFREALSHFEGNYLRTDDAVRALPQAYLQRAKKDLEEALTDA